MLSPRETCPSRFRRSPQADAKFCRIAIPELFLLSFFIYFFPLFFSRFISLPVCPFFLQARVAPGGGHLAFFPQSLFSGTKDVPSRPMPAPATADRTRRLRQPEAPPFRGNQQALHCRSTPQQFKGRIVGPIREASLGGAATTCVRGGGPRAFGRD